jgi:tetratricopeptide (TPR) repeat protein
MYGHHNAREYASFIAETSVAQTVYQANGYTTALIHLSPQAALSVMDRYIRQFSRDGSLRQLHGQLMWQLGDLWAAMSDFEHAIELERDSINLLAVAHFHLEQGELVLAQEFANDALQVARPFEKDVCLLTLAIIYWLAGERTKGLDMAIRLRNKLPGLIQTRVLRYDVFWRQRAIGVFEEMLAQATANPV